MVFNPYKKLIIYFKNNFDQAHYVIIVSLLSSLKLKQVFNFLDI